MNFKITEQHRSRPAYIYVRQSTNAQVLHHQESTERQYALRTMALELGWSESAIRTLDRDLGMTGTEMTRREDFKTLVADVSMGQVGAAFALEVSRLARSNLDWHRLLELCALKNPSYAGMYVFGRYQYRREINLDGEVRKRMQAVAMPDWRVRLQQHHEGYITLEEFVKNRERLQKNRTNGEETVLSGPAREGLALLQGLLLCGHCGHALTIRYRGNGGICPTYQCNLLRREGLATKSCMVFRCDLLDGVIAEEMLKALQPAELELALSALHELESRDQSILRQWQMRLERAEYEVALAERRYQEVDPANRLVAGALERRWNDALVHLEDLKKEAAEFQRREAHVATPEQKAQVLALARDLPRLWHAPTTQSKDRKRMLRLLIKDITVEKPANQKQLLVHIRWQGGACSDVSVQLPLSIADRVRYPSTVVDKVRELARHLPDSEIADHLNREGQASAKGLRYTVKIVQWIRCRYRIPPAELKRPEELTVRQVAQRFARAIKSSTIGSSTR